MTEHSYRDYKILLLASLQDNGLWACSYIVDRQDGGNVPAPRHTPPGLWDSKDHAEAGALRMRRRGLMLSVPDELF